MIEEHNTRLRNGDTLNPRSGVLSLQHEELPPGAAIARTSSDGRHAAAGNHESLLPHNGASEGNRLTGAEPRNAEEPSPEPTTGIAMTLHQPARTADRSSSLPAGQSSMENSRSEPQADRSPKRARMDGRGCKNLKDLLVAPVGSVFGGKFRVYGTVPPVSILETATLKRLVAEEARDGSASGAKLVWRFAATLDDGTAQLHAIMCDTSGEAMIGMKAAEAMASGNQASAMFNLEKLTHEGRALGGRVRSVEYQGFKYFLIDDVCEETVNVSCER